nr:transposase, mutator type [Tanacetum cinerariifolium]
MIMEVDSESEYATDLVDEEHLVDEVEVNMSSFKFKIDQEHDTEFIDPIQPHVNAIEDDLEAFDFDSLESDQEDVPKNARSRCLDFNACSIVVGTSLEYNDEIKALAPLDRFPSAMFATGYLHLLDSFS